MLHGDDVLAEDGRRRIADGTVVVHGENLLRWARPDVVDERRGNERFAVGGGRRGLGEPAHPVHPVVALTEQVASDRLVREHLAAGGGVASQGIEHGHHRIAPWPQVRAVAGLAVERVDEDGTRRRRSRGRPPQRTAVLRLVTACRHLVLDDRSCRLDEERRAQTPAAEQERQGDAGVAIGGRSRLLTQASTKSRANPGGRPEPARRLDEAIADGGCRGERLVRVVDLRAELDQQLGGAGAAEAREHSVHRTAGLDGGPLDDDHVSIASLAARRARAAEATRARDALAPGARHAAARPRRGSSLVKATRSAAAAVARRSEIADPLGVVAQQGHVS